MLRVTTGPLDCAEAPVAMDLRDEHSNFDPARNALDFWEIAGHSATSTSLGAPIDRAFRAAAIPQDRRSTLKMRLIDETSVPSAHS